MPIYPISFSIPKQKIIDRPYQKTQFMSNLIPGIQETYIYEYESDYYAEYQKSLFAVTMKKGGWDCMRHYEILANGCIPFFVGLENCPPTIVTTLPKSLLLQTNELFIHLSQKYKITPFSNNSPIVLTKDEWETCYRFADELLEYTKHQLTTEHMCRNIISKLPNVSPQKILLFQNKPCEDYLESCVQHGFKSVFHKDCHEFPYKPYMYENSHIDVRTMYGKGFTYTEGLNNELYDLSGDADMEKNIENREYDIIIYCHIHREKPMLEKILNYYPPEKIVLMCGEDEHVCCWREWSDKGHVCFVRECN